MDAVSVMALLHALRQQVRHVHLKVSLPTQELSKAEAIVALAEAELFQAEAIAALVEVVPAEAVALAVVVKYNEFKHLIAFGSV